MLIIAILTGAASFANYLWWASIGLPDGLKIASLAAQAALTLITAVTAARYRGKRLRKSYDGAGYKIFTLPFALVVLSLLGNLAVLTVLLLNLIGVIKAL
jgi:hypothetical protein